MPSRNGRVKSTGRSASPTADLPICTACGACCATYRVAFARRELESEPGGWVPVAFVDRIGPRRARMRCTGGSQGRCIALLGTVGVDVSCAIYERRPGPCRAFGAGAAAGRGDPACGDARRRHGMPPLGGSYQGFPIA